MLDTIHGQIRFKDWPWKVSNIAKMIWKPLINEHYLALFAQKLESEQENNIVQSANLFLPISTSHEQKQHHGLKQAAT